MKVFENSKWRKYLDQRREGRIKYVVEELHNLYFLTKRYKATRTEKETEKMRAQFTGVWVPGKSKC
jgi:hypothetical protein